MDDETEIYMLFYLLEAIGAFYGLFLVFVVHVFRILYSAMCRIKENKRKFGVRVIGEIMEAVQRKDVEELEKLAHFGFWMAVETENGFVRYEKDTIFNFLLSQSSDFHLEFKHTDVIDGHLHLVTKVYGVEGILEVYLMVLRDISGEFEVVSGCALMEENLMGEDDWV